MNDNKWKYLSFVLMAIIAIPTVSNIVAPQAFAAATDSILTIVTDIQSKVNNTTFGLQAIKNAINTLQTSANNGATQTSVNTLQTTANAINAKTDNLPSDPASSTDVSNARFQIENSIADAVSQIGPTKAVVIDYEVNPPDGSNVPKVAIALETDRTYSGTISFKVSGGSGNEVRILCLNPSSGVVGFDQIVGLGDSFTRDFICEALVFSNIDPTNDVNAPPISVKGIVQYVELDSSNVRLLD